MDQSVNTSYFIHLDIIIKDILASRKLFLTKSIVRRLLTYRRERNGSIILLYGKRGKWAIISVLDDVCGMMTRRRVSHSNTEIDFPHEPYVIFFVTSLIIINAVEVVIRDTVVINNENE